MATQTDLERADWEFTRPFRELRMEHQQRSQQYRRELNRLELLQEELQQVGLAALQQERDRVASKERKRATLFFAFLAMIVLELATPLFIYLWHRK